jgi:hypothetical protein
MKNSLLGYNVMEFVESQPTYWRNTSPPFSGLKSKPSKQAASKVSCLAYSSTLKMEVTCSETLAVFQWTTWHYIPENRTLWNKYFHISIHSFKFQFCIIIYIIRSLGDGLQNITNVWSTLIIIYYTFYFQQYQLIYRNK